MWDEGVKARVKEEESRRRENQGGRIKKEIEEESRQKESRRRSQGGRIKKADLKKKARSKRHVRNHNRFGIIWGSYWNHFETAGSEPDLKKGTIKRARSEPQSFWYHFGIVPESF